MDANKKYLVFAYTGSGKTYTKQHYSNAVEVDLCCKYICDADSEEELEKQKLHPGNMKNPDFPDNYIREMRFALNTNNIVTTPLTYESFALIINLAEQDKNREIIIVTPEISCVEDYMERWVKRGNSLFFMAERLKSFYTMNNFFQNLTGYTQIVLKSGQYLSEALIAHGVPLIPRESDCETIEIDLPTSGEMVNK